MKGKGDHKKALNFAWTKIINLMKDSIVKNELSTLEDGLKMSGIKPHLGELMQTAIFCKNTHVIRLLINNGCDLFEPPAVLTQDAKSGSQQPDSDYKPTPHIIYAACLNSMEAIDIFLAKGCSLNSKGHIGNSPKRRNSVISNCFGAAAFNGNLFTLKWMVQKGAKVDIEFKAEEKRGQSGVGLFREEVAQCTPLLLAVVKGDGNLNVVKWLITDLKCNVKAKDSQGNTLVHLAVKYNCEEILGFLIKEIKIDPFERNTKGETPAIIANELGLEKIQKMLSQINDGCNEKLRELMDLIENEEEEEKAKKKNIENKKKKKKQKKKKKNQQTLPNNIEVKQERALIEEKIVVAIPIKEEIKKVPAVTKKGKKGLKTVHTKLAEPPKEMNGFSSKDNVAPPVVCTASTEVQTVESCSKAIYEYSSIVKELTLTQELIRDIAVQIELSEYELQCEQEYKKEIDQKLYHAHFSKRSSSGAIVSTAHGTPEYESYKHLLEDNKGETADLLELVNKELKAKDELLKKMRKLFQSLKQQNSIG